MRLYRHDNSEEDCRLPHRNGDDISEAELNNLGVRYYQFPVDSSSSRDDVDKLASSRKYEHRDEITVSPQAMGSVYEEKIEMFYREHLHEDEEIRYILDGKGYFDVRAKEDDWLRIFIEPGDLLILPPGIYHRFTVDEDNYIHALRLFRTNPKWAAIPRSEETDSNTFRTGYIEQRSKGVFE